MRVLVLALAILLVSSCASPPGETTTLAADGMIEWLNLPSAVYDAEANKTFFAYQSLSSPEGPLDAVWVNCYDHRTGQIGEPIELHAYASPEDGRDVPDDHGSPAIALNGEGRLVVAYAKHTSRLYYRVGESPHDHSRWGTEKVLEPADVTYPQLYLMPDDEMVILYRYLVGGKGDLSTSATHLRRSLDGGTTWQKPVTLFSMTGVVPYVQSWHLGDEIHIALTPYVYAEQRYRNVYHMYSADGGDTWMRSSGEPLDLPTDTYRMSLVYRDESIEWSWVHDIKVAAPGDPRILFFRDIPNLRSGSGSYTEMHAAYATLSAGAWETNDIAPSAFYGSGSARGIFPCGGSIDPQDPDRVLLSRGMSGRSEDNTGCDAKIELWVTGDRGRDWEQHGRISDLANGFEMRPQFVKNGTDELRAVYVHVDSYDGITDWASKLVGVGGLVASGRDGD